MRQLFLGMLVVVAGCQSVQEPITASSLPEPKPSSGMPRFPVQEEAIAATDVDETPVAVVEEVEEVVVVPATNADGTACDRKPLTMSSGAVANLCETTESFARSLGFNDAQIAQIMNDGRVEAIAH